VKLARFKTFPIEKNDHSHGKWNWVSLKIPCMLKSPKSYISHDVLFLVLIYCVRYYEKLIFSQLLKCNCDFPVKKTKRQIKKMVDLRQSKKYTFVINRKYRFFVKICKSKAQKRNFTWSILKQYRVFHNCWNKAIGHKSRILNDTTMMITFIEGWKDNIL